MERASSGLIGRDAELAMLRRGLRTAIEEERTVVSILSGPAGIGKGRLRQEVQAELEGALAASGQPSAMLARARPHQRSVALSVMRTMLEGRSDHLAQSSGAPRLDANAPLGERQYAVHRLASSAVNDKRKAAACAEFFGELLGVHMPENETLRAARADPQLMADRLRGALRDFCEGLLERGPLGVFVEELQWADAESTRFLAELTDVATDHPLYVLTTARPELETKKLDLFSGRDVVSIELQGLAPFDVAALARSLVGRPLSDALVRALYERTGGNPLFVEQIVSALADQGRLDDAVGELPLPLDVEAAVQSRLDHLPQIERELVKRASIFGRPFYFPELAALGVPDASRHLDALIKRGILASRGKQRGGDRGPELRFRSALVADVANRMIGEAQRLELHRRAASYLADLPDTDSEELARHYELGDAKLLAGKHYAIASLKASRQADSERVVRCARRARELGPPKAVLFELAMAENEALQFLGRPREEKKLVLDRALAAASSEADRARALTELLKWIAKSDLPEALKTGREAVLAARKAGSPEVLALALGRYGIALMNAGELAEASAVLEEAEQVAERCPLHIAALTAGWRGQLIGMSGDLGARRGAFVTARDRYLAAGDLRRAAGAEANLADVNNRLGDYAQAESSLRQALATCRKLGNKPMEGYAMLNLGYSLSMLERPEEALAALAQVKTLADAMQDPRLALFARLYTARALLGTTHAEDVKVGADRDAEDVAMEAEGRGQLSIAASALTVAARLHLARGEYARALVLTTRAMGLLERIGSLEEDEADVYIAHAKALVANGQNDAAKSVVKAGAKRVTEIARGIEDPALRKRFLEDVPAHRELMAAFKSRRPT